MVCEGDDPVVEEAVPPRIEAAVREAVASVAACSGVDACVGSAWTWAGERTADELLAAADASMYRFRQTRH